MSNWTVGVTGKYGKSYSGRTWNSTVNKILTHIANYPLIPSSLIRKFASENKVFGSVFF